MLRILFLLLLATPGIAAAEDLGRLFTTPAQRESLDHLRQITPRFEANTAQSDEGISELAEPVLPPAISLQGYVKRSDGKKGTVWVNGTPMQENSSNDEVAVGKLRKGNQVQLKVPGLGKNLSLKAGQTYIPETNSVVEINAHQEPSDEDVGTIGSDPLAMPLSKQASEIGR